jgi:hypothetical protein
MKRAASRAVKNRGRGRAARRLQLIGGVLLAAAAFLVGTPYLFLAIARLRANDWTQFSNEGQAYGGIAAVFGMLALLGVAASLVLQSRETAISRELAQRNVHTDLLSKALDDPALLACWGPTLDGDEVDRQHIYTNMIVQFWRSMFEIGKVTEDQLHGLAAQMFGGEPGRRYWSAARTFQKTYYASDIDAKFFDTMEHEYNAALAHTATNPQPPVPSPSPDDGGRSTASALALGLIGGAILYKMMTRLHRAGKQTP